MPAPEASIDLAGTWSESKDYFHVSGQVTLPGKYEARTIRRRIVVPEQYKDRNIVLSISAERCFSVLINKTMVRFYNNIVGGNELNLTPWIRFGQANDIELLSIYDKGEVHPSSAGYLPEGCISIRKTNGLKIAASRRLLKRKFCVAQLLHGSHIVSNLFRSQSSVQYDQFVNRHPIAKPMWPPLNRLHDNVRCARTIVP